MKKNPIFINTSNIITSYTSVLHNPCQNRINPNTYPLLFSYLMCTKHVVKINILLNISNPIIINIKINCIKTFHLEQVPYMSPLNKYYWEHLAC